MASQGPLVDKFEIVFSKKFCDKLPVMLAVGSMYMHCIGLYNGWNKKN